MIPIDCDINRLSGTIDFVTTNAENYYICLSYYVCIIATMIKWDFACITFNKFHKSSLSFC